MYKIINNLTALSDESSSGSAGEGERADVLALLSCIGIAPDRRVLIGSSKTTNIYIQVSFLV